MSWRPLAALVKSNLDDRAGRWWVDALAQVQREGIGGPGFMGRWNAAARVLGKQPLRLSEPDRLSLQSGSATLIPTSDWGVDELGRAVLLLVAVELPLATDVAVLVDDLFRTGELREQQALLRILAYLPDPARYVAVAEDAVRANALSLLSALACDNPYPASYMPELTFNHLVMKALFNGVTLGKMLGLADRCGEDLRRMVGAWVSERRAAGRTFPDDVNLILQGA